jgi:peptide/nickel transport system substrate-binding protein
MSDVSRRTLLKLAASLPPAVGLPATWTSPAAAAGGRKTITAVMHSDLRIIDPGFTTA